MSTIANPGNRDRLWRTTVIALPYFWLGLFFLAPFAIVFKISLAEPLIAQPPFSPLWDWADDGTGRLLATLDNYLFLLEDKL